MLRAAEQRKCLKRQNGQQYGTSDGGYEKESREGKMPTCCGLSHPDLKLPLECDEPGLKAFRKGSTHLISFLDHLCGALAPSRGVVQIGKPSICDSTIIEDTRHDLGFNCSIVSALGISGPIRGGKPDSKRPFVFESS